MWKINRLLYKLPNRPFAKTNKDNRAARLVDINFVVDEINLVLEEIEAATVPTEQSLASVLLVGKETNGTNISVTSGDNILLDSNEEGTSIASKIQFDADTFIRLDVSENGYLELNAPGGVAMQWDAEAGSYFAIEEGGYIENTDGNFSQTLQFPPFTQNVYFNLPADKAGNQTIAMLSDIGGAVETEMFFAASDATTPLVVANNTGGMFATHDITPQSLFAGVSIVGGTSGVTTIDILSNGSSILTTLITIDFGEATSLTAAVQPVIQVGRKINKGDRISTNITTISGDGTEAGLQITLNGVRT
jgi:hypothetical protein